jgi:hypothetical protein
VYQDVDNIGFGDVFRAKGLFAMIASAFTMAAKDDIDPHNAPCGRPCGEGMCDGVSRHTGLDCPACTDGLWRTR